MQKTLTDVFSDFSTFSTYAHLNKSSVSREITEATVIMQALTSTPLAWPEESLRSYKYREVWMRALVKIRAGASVALLGQDIKLFGSDTLRGDKTADLTQPDLARKLIQRQISVIPSCGLVSYRCAADALHCLRHALSNGLL
jgi:hypothetical protein